MEWSQRYGGLSGAIGLEEAYSLVEIPDDGFALAGFTLERPSGNRDLACMA